MKKFICIALLSIAPFLKSQHSEKSQNSLEKFSKIEFGFQGINFGYELPLSEKNLLDLNIGLGGGYYFTMNEINYNYTIVKPNVFLKSEYRRYYNRDKRLEKNKNNENNSGNYYGGELKVSFSEFERSNHNVGILDFHWGMQRSLGGNWLFNLQGGLGVGHDFNTTATKLFPVVGLKFGYIFK